METTTTGGRKRNYINNKDLLEQLRLSHEKGEMTNELVNMLILLVDRYATKGCFASYTYNDEMRAEAIANLVKAWRKFNMNYSNPFAFFTQCIKNSFRQVLKIEKKEANGRNTLLIANGLNPSFNFTDEDYNELMGNDIEPKEHIDYHQDERFSVYDDEVILDHEIDKVLDKEFGPDVEVTEETNN